MLCLFFLTNCKQKTETSATITDLKNDSTTVWIAEAKNKKLSIEKRTASFDKAYQFSLNSNQKDSVVLKSLSDLSLLASNNQIKNKFRSINKLAFKLAHKLKDSISIANLHWDAGSFYDKIHIRDSSFFHYKNAQQIFEAQKKDISSARMHMNMAKQQTDSKDYVASEINLIKALDILIPLKKYKHIYTCYNRLGINFNNLGNYDTALSYYSKAQNYETKYKSRVGDKESVLNNIGIVYQKQNKHELAIINFKKAIANKKIKKIRSSQFAKVLGNLGLSKMQLGDSIESINLFNRAITIGDSIDNKDIVATNKIRLANYYLLTKDTIAAIASAKSAVSIAKTASNYRDYLQGLELLSDIDHKNAIVHSKLFIKVTDSLHKEERKLRDKFARIQFETDTVLSENKILSEKLIRNLAIASFTLIIACFLYFRLSKKSKQAKRLHTKDQEMANQEISALLQSQQHKLEKGKNIAQQRISEELHDGVLGRLFGTRLSLGSLNNSSGDDIEKERERFIEEIKNIEEDIRNISHELHTENNAAIANFTLHVQQLLEQQAALGKLTLNFLMDDAIVWKTVSDEYKIHIYRILQEASKNCISYAKATTLSVTFTQKQEQIYLSIKDNGNGFDLQTVKKGIGIKNMTSRSKKMNGTFSVTSKKGKGTSLKIKIPTN